MGTAHIKKGHLLGVLVRFLKRIKTIPFDLNSEGSYDSDIALELEFEFELELKECELELKLPDSQTSKEGRTFAPKIDR